MAEHEFRIHNRLAAHHGNRIGEVARPARPPSRLRMVGMHELRPARGARAWVPLLQGGWFVASGLWPLLHPASFEALSGAKMDLWLARVVGVVIAVIGATLLFARVRRQVGAEMVFLGLVSAVVLAVVDVLVATSGAGTDAYLADAVLELVFAAGWALGCSARGGHIRVVTWNPDPERRPWK